MIYEVRLTQKANRDIHQIHDWWYEHRSPEQADRWFEEILEAFKSLRKMPERCAAAPESVKSGRNVRQLLFTIGKRNTHRIVFLIESDQVWILRVRHVAQDQLPEDSTGDDSLHQ
ncbi:MAG: type II toxin-antitoxin system RelE/ParE family toxin [Planctomycetota bacterium]